VEPSKSRRLAAWTAAAALLPLALASPAQAVNRYTIQPGSPKPAACNNSGTIPACGAFYNYYSDSTYGSGALRDPAGTPSSEVRYRFTANGGAGMVVH
jgi:hypothetical protein